jgi:hypothetical protein
MLVTLHKGKFGWDYVIEAQDGRTILIQNDYDYPVIASHLGYLPCPCGETDGTIDCKHKNAVDMIYSAQLFLDDHLEECFADPGYFEEG